MTSPTQRTKRYLEKDGYTVGIVEKFNRFAGPHGIRQDLFGFGDAIAMKPGQGHVIMVQACAGGSHPARRTKILAETRALTWLRAGQAILLISWSKRGKRNERKLWQPRLETITEEMFTQKMRTDA